MHPRSLQATPRRETGRRAAAWPPRDRQSNSSVARDRSDGRKPSWATLRRGFRGEHLRCPPRSSLFSPPPFGAFGRELQFTQAWPPKILDEFSKLVEALLAHDVETL